MQQVHKEPPTLGSLELDVAADAASSHDANPDGAPICVDAAFRRARARRICSALRSRRSRSLPP
jgi:hypothetical protein